MSFRLTYQAEQDLIAIYVHGAGTFGTTQAERYHRGLVALFGLLAAAPAMAPERMELDPPVRLHPYRAHLVVYVAEADGVLIVRILHGRQDWEHLLGG